MKCNVPAVHRGHTMATEPKRQAKSETLTIRLDPKTRFVLEYMSRLKGQNITTVVERSIYEAANSSGGFGRDASDWKQLWDVSDGVRSIKIAKEEGVFTTYEEDKMLEFVSAHKEFFFADNEMKHFRRWSIDILWPNIRTYIEEWSNDIASDYFKAGKSMAKALKDAGVTAPIWPRENKKLPAPEKGASFGRSSPMEQRSGSMSDAIDDDIPF